MRDHARWFPCLVLLCACLAAGAAAASGGRNGGADNIPGPAQNERRSGPPPEIVNRVLDLLPGPVLLENGTDHAVWESREFDTAQFDVIAVKTDAEVGAGILSCNVVWSFGPGDSFTDLSPVVFNPRTTYVARSLASDDVLGLLGKVRCSALPMEIIDGIPSPASASLERVRVLLRRS